MSVQTLKGKVALVTGGGTGLGLGGAKRLAEEGAFVYIVGRRQSVLDEAIRQIGPNARAIVADVSRKEEMVNVASIIQQEKSQLDIIFSNAGYCIGKKLEEVSEDFFDDMLNVNLKGQLFTVQAMLPIMNAGGSIILTSSMTAFIGLPEYTTYAASKAAVIGMARVWTTELKSRNIRVNVISPGAIPTEGYETVQGMTPEQIEDFAAKCAAEIPVGRVGRANEIGDGVVFLASDASSFINGINLTIDGGQTQVYAGNLS
ncbi:KR domain-containing protein [Hafnia paralvei]|uniref:SDR family NAD(P)-dependent oxidoreductase n=1 Tax=Hafnia paralvei TaxID=546367 RepID=UPI00076B3448|nr:SDR family oxidoreductase [Hafnia paralvei]AMH18201.1 KR domain-containing protein [Hafnia paralvei]